MTNVFDNKVVLITGGTGSFGQWIVSKLLKTNVTEVRILSRDEEKQLDLQRKISDKRLSYMLGDVRDYDRVAEACKGTNIVYHAAAQKIIDFCEVNPSEALKTNIMGSMNVKRACESEGIETAILISTDKAVKPVNLYGMTKGVAEHIWTNSSQETRFAVVRYGNVLGSRGSIAPFFKELIKANKPLPITDTAMTRFLITLNQACELVFYVTENAENARIYVPNLPACRITDLAKALAGESYPQIVVGVRPGEKIHECLIQEYEVLRTSLQDEYYVINPEPIAHPALEEEYTSDKTRMMNIPEIQSLLKEAEKMR